MGIASEKRNNDNCRAERALWCLVLHQALTQAKRGNKNALKLFQTEWCKELCGYLGLSYTCMAEQAVSTRPLYKEAGFNCPTSPKQPKRERFDTDKYNKLRAANREADPELREKARAQWKEQYQKRKAAKHCWQTGPTAIVAGTQEEHHAN
jgi:hypothetical protein